MSRRRSSRRWSMTDMRPSGFGRRRRRLRATLAISGTATVASAAAATAARSSCNGRQIADCMPCSCEVGAQALGFQDSS